MRFHLCAFCWALITALALNGAVPAQSLVAMARINADQSAITQRGDTVEVRLSLSQGVPFRIFTLDEPRRLVLDFRQVDWSGLPPTIGAEIPAISQIRFGLFRPSWSRMVLDLAEPLAVKSAEMAVSPASGTALLALQLSPTGPESFTKTAGAPDNALWPSRKFTTAPAKQANRLRLAIDPGHGGIDPGAVRKGVTEKSIALDFGLELRAALANHPKFDVFMTREIDEFLSLRERVLAARQAKADLYLSLHANTVTVGDATGATVYMLSDEASDQEAAALAEKENRADILGGVQLAGEEDAVARILVDLAQGRTNMRSKAFGDLLVKGLRNTVGVIRSRPLRSAGFEVLKAPEIPSVLLELGFLSNREDRANMQSPLWRAEAIKGIIATLENWVERDAEQRTLNLQ